jgi:hypothetical protein
MDAGDRRLDGNAAAGMLAECFAFEVTNAHAVCAGCGAEGPVGALVTFGLPMGAILRCPGCGVVVIRLVQHTMGSWLDVRGLSVLRIPPRD